MVQPQEQPLVRLLEHQTSHRRLVAVQPVQEALPEEQEALPEVQEASREALQALPQVERPWFLR